MPARSVVTLDQFREWLGAESAFEDTLKASIAAMAQHSAFAQADIEVTSVVVRLPGGEELDCYSSKERPFLVRPLETPMEEFKRWRPQEGEGYFVLEPRWRVRVLRDPLQRALQAQQKGVEAFVFARTYTAARLHATADPAPA